MFIFGFLCGAGSVLFINRFKPQLVKFKNKVLSDVEKTLDEELK